MTGRERFRETTRYGTPDRVPHLEEGLRDDVLAQWRAQGLPPDADLGAIFHYDRREQVPVNVWPGSAVERLPTSACDLAALRDRLDPDDPERLPPDWPERVAGWRERDHILELFVHPGFFQALGVNDWSRLEEVLYLVHDAPELVRGAMQAYGDFVARLVERVLHDVEVDYATFSEPIAGPDRPLLSPATYERLALATYAPIVEALQRGGVETIVFQTYANPRMLLPAVVRAGFDTLWAIEANPEAMDYRAIRREFGRDLRLIGGIDLDALLAGPDAIRREVAEKAVPLLAEGGYIPLADGRVRATVSLESYRLYRAALEEATAQTGRL